MSDHRTDAERFIDSIVESMEGDLADFTIHLIDLLGDIDMDEWDKLAKAIDHATFEDWTEAEREGI